MSDPAADLYAQAREALTTLAAAIERGAPTDRERRSPWVPVLEREVYPRLSGKANWDPRTAAHEAQEARRWATFGTPFDLHDDPGRGPRFEDPSPLVLLRVVAPDVWCRSIDALPTAHWISLGALFSLPDFEAATGVLAQAPRVFLDDGEWTRSMAAVVAIDRALDALDGELAKLAVQEFPPVEADPWSPEVARKLDTLVAAIDARPDGDLLALRLLARVVRNHVRVRLRYHRAPARLRLAARLEALLRLRPPRLEALASLCRSLWRGSLHRDFRDDRVRSPVGERTAARAAIDVIEAALASVSDRADSGRLRGLWDLLTEALRVRDPGLREPLDSDLPWSHRWVLSACLLAWQPDPVTAFDGARVVIDDQLERLAHRFAAGDYEAGQVPQWLSLITCLAATIGATESPDQTWPGVLYRRGIDLAVHVASLLDDPNRARGRRAWIECLSLAPKVRHAWNRDTLRELLWPLTGVPEDQLAVACELVGGGLSRSLVEEAIGTNLGTLWDRVRERATCGLLTTDRFRELEALATRCGLPTSAPSQPPALADVAGVVVAAQGSRTLMRVGPFADLARSLGVNQPIGVLTVRGTPAASDIFWAREEVRRHATEMDAEIVVVRGWDDARPLPARAVRWRRDATEAELDAAVRNVLVETDPFDRREVVVGFQHVGRKDLLRELAEDALSFRMTGVFGLRRVGKTSAVHAALALAGPSLFPIWVDLQGIVQRDLQGVVATIDRAVSEQSERPAQNLLPGSHEPLALLDSILAALRAIRRDTERTPCLVIDEVDLLFESSDRGPGVTGIERVMDILQAQVDARALSLVVIGRDARRFQRPPRYDGAENPWAGRVRTHWLPALDRNEAHELLSGLGRRCGLVLSAPTVAHACVLAGGHPLLLRLYGRALFELARGPGTAPRLADPLARAAEERFLAMPDTLGLVGDALALLGECFPGTWRAVAPALLKGRRPKVSSMNPTVLEHLRHFGLADASGRLPDAVVRLAPVAAPSLERAA